MKKKEETLRISMRVILALCIISKDPGDIEEDSGMIAEYLRDT